VFTEIVLPTGELMLVSTEHVFVKIPSPMIQIVMEKIYANVLKEISFTTTLNQFAFQKDDALKTINVNNFMVELNVFKVIPQAKNLDIAFVITDLLVEMKKNALVRKEIELFGLLLMMEMFA